MRVLMAEIQRFGYTDRYAGLANSSRGGALQRPPLENRPTVRARMPSETLHGDTGDVKMSAVEVVLKSSPDGLPVMHSNWLPQRHHLAGAQKDRYVVSHATQDTDERDSLDRLGIWHCA